MLYKYIIYDRVKIINPKNPEQCRQYKLWSAIKISIFFLFICQRDDTTVYDPITQHKKIWTPCSWVLLYLWMESPDSMSHQLVSFFYFVKKSLFLHLLVWRLIYWHCYCKIRFLWPWSMITNQSHTRWQSYDSQWTYLSLRQTLKFQVQNLWLIQKHQIQEEQLANMQSTSSPQLLACSSYQSNLGL